MNILPAALTACDAQTNNNATADSADATSGDGFEEVDNVSQLEETGQIINEESILVKII
jgi:cytochrome b6-f complex iron-sulfur subunit